MNPSLHLSDKSTKARCRAINNHFLEASHVDHFKHLLVAIFVELSWYQKLTTIFARTFNGAYKIKRSSDFVIKI